MLTYMLAWQYDLVSIYIYGKRTPGKWAIHGLYNWSDITHKSNLLLRLVEAFKVGAGHTRYLEMLQKGFGFVCSCSFLLMLLTKHHVLMILWVFTYVPIAAQAVSPWAGSQGSPEFGDVWGAIHHPSDADHTKPYEGIMCLHSGPYSRIILIYTQDIRKNRVPYIYTPWPTMYKM